MSGEVATEPAVIGTRSYLSKALGCSQLPVVTQTPEAPAVKEDATIEVTFRVERKHHFALGLDAGAESRLNNLVLLLTFDTARCSEMIDLKSGLLAPHEAEALFEIFAGLRASGYSIIFISHKLNEVLACSDEITVLRRGKVVGTIQRSACRTRKIPNTGTMSQASCGSQ